MTGCSSSSTSDSTDATDSQASSAEAGDGGMDHGSGSGPAEPAVEAAESDWQSVADTLGRTGTLDASNTVYKVPLPRSDLKVRTRGVKVAPGLSLGGYAAFVKYDSGYMLMGDLVVTEAELPAVTDALQAAGLEQTALHKHLPQQSPPVWWTHIHGMGEDPAALAQSVQDALDATAIPPADSAPPAKAESIDLDTDGIDQALGATGTAESGIYKFSFARAEPITDGAHELPSGLGLTTAINFQPLGNGRAAINGDFAMLASEVQDVAQQLRAGGIEIVEIHNHGLDDEPRLFYMHFWATGDAVDLAETLRSALDQTNTA